MTYVSNWFIFALTFLMRGLGPVLTEDPIKYACSGDSIPLFQTITIDSPKMTASLVISGSTTRTIAVWTHNETTISDGYSRKVLLEKCGNVWILNITLSDEAKYILFRNTETVVNTSSVYLSVLVSPSRSCKPNITRVDDVLSASLESSYCGKPVVSVYWLQYPNVQYVSKDLIKLPPKTNAGTYYACIEGPAVSCAKNSTLLDYCSSFTVDNNISEASHESSPKETLPTGLLITAVMGGTVVMICVILIVILCVKQHSLKGTDVEQLTGIPKHNKLPESNMNTPNNIVNDNSARTDQDVDDIRMNVGTVRDQDHFL